MGYALFAQRKLVLDTQLNSLQLQQTQRSDTQYQLATDSLGLQKELSSYQASQSAELAPLYDKMASSTSDKERQKYEERKKEAGAISPIEFEGIDKRRVKED